MAPKHFATFGQNVFLVFCKDLIGRSRWAIFQRNETLQIALDSLIDARSVHYMQHSLASAKGKSIPAIGLFQRAKLPILEGAARLHNEYCSDTRGTAFAEVDARSVHYLLHVQKSMCNPYTICSTPWPTQTVNRFLQSASFNVPSCKFWRAVYMQELI